MRSLRSAGVLLFAVALLSSACSSSSPTSAGPLPSKSASLGAAPDYSLDTADSLRGEDFDCSNVGSVRIRFGPPGFADGDHVGLYVFFEGLPEGPKRLRIWWDYENDPTTFRDFVLAVDATEHEEVYQHRYGDLTGPTEMLVRVELIRDGLTGNCARNRHVVVFPPLPPSAPAPPPVPAPQTGNVGPPVTAVDSFGFGAEGARFTALQTLTLASVWVDPGAGSGTVVISLMDSTGSTVLASKSAAVTTGPQRVSLGFVVPPGDYVLCLDPSGVGPLPAMGYTSSGASFPYSVAGVITLSDTAFGWGPFGLYFYLYDWQVTW